MTRTLLAALLLTLTACADTSPAAVEACGKACAPWGVYSISPSSGCLCNQPGKVRP